MFLVQILLPLFDNAGARQAPALFADVRRELVARFGGLTAYSRAPAEGLWERQPGDVSRDEVVILEVMTEDLDRDWWSTYRATLENRFSQQSLVMRATPFDRL